MFITFGIKKDDAAIVEVEGGACAFIAGYLLPARFVAPDVLNDNHGLLVAERQQGVEVRYVLYIYPSQLYLL